MKLPRGVRADRLIHALQRLGYEVIRQKGSHVRLRKEGGVAHVVTIPLHDPLKTGTFHGIVTDVVANGGVDLVALLRAL